MNDLSKTEDNHLRRGRKFKLKVWLPLLLDFLIVVVIAIQAYIYQKQSNLMSRAINETIRTRELENRPWVNAEKAELTRPIDLGSDGRFVLLLTVTLKNYGTSPAVNGMPMLYAIPQATYAVSRDHNKACERLEDQQKSVPTGSPYNPWPNFLLAPGQSTNLALSTSSNEISHDQAKAGSFFVLGCATYTDQFNKTHRTRFCLKPTSSLDSQGRVSFDVCNTLQTAD